MLTDWILWSSWFLGARAQASSSMQNAEGQTVELYIPRKCSWTHRLITSDDHAAVQINVGIVDAATGRYTGEFHTFALSGSLRKRGEADIAIADLTRRADARL